MRGRGRCQCRRHRAHAADRYVPHPGAPAQQVVEEAHVLPQRRVAQTGERADKRIGGHHAADQIAADGIGDRMSQRALDERLPRRRGIRPAVLHDIAPGLLRVDQRPQQRRPQGLGDCPAAAVELLETRLVRAGSHRVERRVRSDQQTAASAVGRVGRVGRVTAPPEAHRGTEIVEDPRRQQADQIGVPGEPGVHPVESRRRYGGAAHVVESLQQPDP